MIRLQLGVLSFWLDVAGLLEWYDVSCLVLSCLSGFASVYLTGTNTACCLVLFCHVFLAFPWFT